MRTVHPGAAALVGIGCRLPGGQSPDVRGPAQAWRALVEGKPAITRYPEHRWQAMQARLHPDDRDGAPWPVAHLELPTGTEAAVFGLRAGDVELLSPAQVLVLETAAEALADAGIPASSLAGPRTGIYVATSSPDPALETFTDQARPRLADLPAGGAGMLATHLSRWLDARGPLSTYDTTCSASVYALDAARRDLDQERVDVAIVVGLNTASSPIVGRAFADGQALAHDGDLAPFDERAHGYVRGEAAVAVVLRPYRQARHAQDRVYAVIEHTAVGADGRSAGVGLPSADAQAELITRAHAEADIHPDAVDVVLAHGTGTAAGDRAEAKALGRAYGLPRRGTAPDPLTVTSVKGLWGHAEGAAGLVSLAATALMLYHDQVPPTAGHHTPHPRTSAAGLQIPTRMQDWPRRGLPVPGLAGINCLGFSGAIGYMLVRRAPRPRRTGPTPLPGAPVLALSAPTPAALHGQATAVADALTPHPGSGPGPRTTRVAAHLAVRCDHHPTRAAVVAPSRARARARAALEALAEGRPHPHLVGPRTAPTPSSLVWAFGGHGAAHPGMGAALYRTDALFAVRLDEAVQALAAQTAGRGWHPLTRPALDSLAVVQQATWAVQVATAATLTDRWGLRPTTVIGHSLGEAAAAHVAGALSLDDAARLVCARSELLERIAPTGGMVTARLDAVDAEQVAAAHGVEVAARNAPQRVVFSGPAARLDAVVQDLEGRGADPRPLAGAPPAHSRAVEPVMDELAAALRGLYPRPLTQGVDLVSTVTARSVPGTDLGSDYWVSQLRAPVDFAAALAVLARRGPALVQELSPHPVLVVPAAEVRARHALDLEVQGIGADGVSLSRAAAHAYIHRVPFTWPYTQGAPIDLEPAPWQAPPPPTLWAERLNGLAGAERDRAVRQIVHQAVADLSPMPGHTTPHHRPPD